MSIADKYVEKKHFKYGGDILPHPKKRSREMKKLLVSFSGGETSAYMAQWLKKHKPREYEMIFVFANTGQENEETLKFVELCDRQFNLGVVWVEAVPMVKLDGKTMPIGIDVFNDEWEGGRVGTSFKIVDYNTANRNGKPFEAVIQKYGIPNMATPHCTRELKEAPIKAYARSIGWKEYYTAIGIREDELDRINSRRESKRLIYPLVNIQPMTKQKINFWWSQQQFRLNLKGYQGNCITCWKKSDPKLFQIAKENEHAFSFFGKMELRYGKYVPKSRLSLMEIRGELPILPVNFFRKNRSVADIMEQSKKWDGSVVDDSVDFDLDGETCEVFSSCGD